MKMQYYLHVSQGMLLLARNTKGKAGQLKMLGKLVDSDHLINYFTFMLCSKYDLPRGIQIGLEDKEETEEIYRYQKEMPLYNSFHKKIF